MSHSSCIEMRHSEERGWGVFATATLAPQTCLFRRCPGVLVLDLPCPTFCGMCGVDQEDITMLEECQQCRAVSLCTACRESEMWSGVHERECAALNELASGPELYDPQALEEFQANVMGFDGSSLMSDDDGAEDIEDEDTDDVDNEGEQFEIDEFLDLKDTDKEITAIRYSNQSHGTGESDATSSKLNPRSYAKSAGWLRRTSPLRLLMRIMGLRGWLASKHWKLVMRGDAEQACMSQARREGGEGSRVDEKDARLPSKRKAQQISRERVEGNKRRKVNIESENQKDNRDEEHSDDEENDSMGDDSLYSSMLALHSRDPDTTPDEKMSVLAEMVKRVLITMGGAATGRCSREEALEVAMIIDDNAMQLCREVESTRGDGREIEAESKKCQDELTVTETSAVRMLRGRLAYATGLFPGACRINNSCTPNAVFLANYQIGHSTPSSSSPSQRDNSDTGSSGGASIRVVVTSPVNSGTEITFNYSELLHPLGLRRRLLYDSYGFICDCPRCVNESNYLKQASSIHQHHCHATTEKGTKEKKKGCTLTSLDQSEKDRGRKGVNNNDIELGRKEILLRGYRCACGTVVSAGVWSRDEESKAMKVESEVREALGRLMQTRDRLGRGMGEEVEDDIEDDGASEESTPVNESKQISDATFKAVKAIEKAVSNGLSETHYLIVRLRLQLVSMLALYSIKKTRKEGVGKKDMSNRPSKDEAVKDEGDMISRGKCEAATLMESLERIYSKEELDSNPAYLRLRIAMKYLK